MCWITSIRPHIQIATENIPVYKIVIKEGGFWFWSTFQSYYQNFIYKLHKIYSEKIEEICSDEANFYSIDEANFYSIDKGIHSYHNAFTKISVSKYGKIWIEGFNGGMIGYYSRSAYRNVVKVQGYIPKGSKYYLNEYGEYVSEQIVLTKYNKIK